MIGTMRLCGAITISLLALTGGVQAADDFEAWPPLTSTFPSTGGNGIMIKGYDPVITGGKCITTFMAVTQEETPKVYSSIAEFEAVAMAGGTLCTNGTYRSFDGTNSGTTPFRMFFKNGTFRAPRT